MNNKQTSGQAIVIMALSMVALIAIIGLAVDGGAVYSMRRQSQNAADSAALAGTQIVADLISTCGTGSGANDAKVSDTVQDFVARNGVDLNSSDTGALIAWYVNKDQAQLAEVGAGSIPNGTTGVQVTVATTQTTIFMRYFAQNLMSASANAVAMTGPVFELGGGVLPIGVEDDAVEFLGSGNEFTVLDDGAYYGDTSSNVGWLNMSHVYNMDHYEQDDSLTRTYVSSAGANDCKYDGGKVDVGATGLKGWASGQCQYPHPILAGTVGGLNGDWIHGVSGMDTSALASICQNYPPGSEVVMPIFDVYWSPSSMGDSGLPTPWLVTLSKYGWVSSSNNQNYYHVVGFVAAEIQECTSKGGSKHITANFVTATIGEGRFDPASGLGSNDPGTCNHPAIISVQLWE